MKLLKDITPWCIQVDVLMWDEDINDEYTEPAYVTINTETKDKTGKPMNLIMFKSTITDNLRVFDTEEEAKDYINTRLKNNAGIIGATPIKITYDCELKKWIRTI